MRKHARLSPSSSSRWINCPGSVLLSEQVPRRPAGPAAEEGTRIHQLAEENLRDRLLQGPKAPEAEDPRWQQVVDDYAAVIADLVGRSVDPELLIEHRVNPLIPQCVGTADAIILDSNSVTVVDLKTGMRPVEPDSPQLRIYALGALALKPLADTVTTVVVQPRLPDPVRTRTFDAEELRDWRVEVALPAARSALQPGAPFSPSEEACRWCPASGMCKAQQELVLQQDFSEDPQVMSAADIAAALDRVEQIEQWAGALRAAAIEHAEWEQLPGWELVPGRGRRKITDESSAVEALTAAGIPAEDITVTKLAPLYVLDKAAEGKLGEVLGDLVAWQPGAPKLRKVL